MATEPTLGRRIMIEATIYKDAPAGTVLGRKAWADLRALCGIADAAERLAEAYRGERMAYWAWENADSALSNQESIALFDALRTAETELRNAVAAWRALGEACG